MNLNGFGYLLHLSLPVYRSVSVDAHTILPCGADKVRIVGCWRCCRCWWWLLFFSSHKILCAVFFFLLDDFPYVFVFHYFRCASIGFQTNILTLLGHPVTHVVFLTHKHTQYLFVCVCVRFSPLFIMILFQILLLSACWLQISTVKL